MRTIIAGSRKIGLIADNTWWPEATQVAFIDRIVGASGIQVTEVVCGMAPGIDTFGRNWAVTRCVPVIQMPADWDRYGRGAGHIRNEEMAQPPTEAAIVIWDGKSPGSKSMIAIAKRLGLVLHLHRFKPEVDDPRMAELVAGFNSGD